MTELTKAFSDGNLDKAEQILCERFPDAPPNTLAAVSVFLFLKAKSIEQLEEVEPRLGEVVEQIKAAWKDNGWTE